MRDDDGHPRKTICTSFRPMWYECPICGEPSSIPRKGGDTVFCPHCRQDVTPVIAYRDKPLGGYGC